MAKMTRASLAKPRTRSRPNGRKYHGHSLMMYIITRGVYIRKYPASRRGEYQPMSFGGKNVTRGRLKGGNVREKGKRERIRKKGRKKKRNRN